MDLVHKGGVLFGCFNQKCVTVTHFSKEADEMVVLLSHLKQQQQ